jgi:hypothetical protein
MGFKKVGDSDVWEKENALYREDQDGNLMPAGHPANETPPKEFHKEHMDGPETKPEVKAPADLAKYDEPKATPVPPGIPTVEAEIVVPEEARAYIVREIDERDQKVILAELDGRQADEWVYAIPFKGKAGVSVTLGIGYAGAKEIARSSGNVKIIPESMAIDIKVLNINGKAEECVLARVFAIEEHSQLVLPGVAVIPLSRVRGQPPEKLHHVAFSLAASIACRNALLNAERDDIKRQFLRSWKAKHPDWESKAKARLGA